MAEQQKNNLNQLLIDEWNYEKNIDLIPANFLPFSNKKVWWRCKICGNEWIAQINSRSRGTGCPICGKKKQIDAQQISLLNKSGTLQEKYPLLGDEWNYEKNGSLLPSQVTPHSNKKVWWICAQGHEWEASVNSRVSGRGCRECSREKGTSFPEQAIYYYMNLLVKAENRYDYKGCEIDVFLPDLKTGIEYDGIAFHNSERSQKRDNEKSAFLKAEGIRLIRVKEDHYTAVKNDIIYCVYSTSYDYLSVVIQQLMSLLGIEDELDIDITRDRHIILQQYLSSVKAKSISSQRPYLMQDWDYDANGKLNPDYISYSSNQKINWKCQVCGYEWKAAVYSRSVGNGCPACAGKVLVEGKNDLLSQNKELADEWDYEKNAPLKPNQITVSNGKKVLWICKACGHSWKASVAHRNNNRGCPECASGKMISTRLSNKIQNEGSLLEVYPGIAKEWNYENNGSLKPENLTAHSGKKVWWKCSVCGTEWEAFISNRVKGHGCPTCFKKAQAERSIRSGLKRNGSIRESNPETLDLWDFEKNADITPDIISKGSHMKVWWRCPKCGHSWESIISNITKGQRCPECAKKSRVQKRLESRGLLK